MANPDRSIIVEIEGRMDSLEAAIRDSEQAVQEGASKIEQGTNQISRSFDRMASRVSTRLIGITAILSTLQSVLRGVTDEFEKALRDGQSIGEIFTGHERAWASIANDTARSVPVFGELVKIGNLLNAEYRDSLQIQHEIEQIQQRQVALMKQAERGQAVRRQSIEGIVAAERQLERIRAVGDGAASARVERQFALEDAEAEHQRRINQILNTQGEAADQFIEIEQRRAAMVRQIIEEEYQKREQALQEMYDEQRRLEEEAEQDRLRRIASIEDQIAQERLKLEGKHFEARLAARQSYYDSLIAQTEDAEERMRLVMLKSLEEQRMMQEEHNRKLEESNRRMLAEQQRVADLESDIRAAQLRLEGRDKEARLEQIRQMYERRIEEAESAREKELLVERMRLAMLEAMQGQGGRSNMTETARTAAGQFRFAQARVQGENRLQVDLARKSEQHLASIRKGIDRMASSPTGVFT